MPELPEVETIRRAMAAKVIGEEIERVEVLHAQVIEPMDAEAFCAALQGKRFVDMARRGKYLLCGLQSVADEVDRALLSIHLRMTGQLHWLDTERAQAQELLPHTHLRLHFRSGAELRYVDIRRFGKWRVLRSIEDDPSLAALGPEPLGDAFSAGYLQQLCRGRKLPIKSLLLNQTGVAGLGNIYCDEALFLAGIRPDRPASSLSPEECAKLRETIRFVLQESIENEGSSLRDYCNIDGRRGSYQEMWRVYQQKDKPCPQCGTAIERIVLGGRSTHLCPHCQR